MVEIHKAACTAVMKVTNVIIVILHYWITTHEQ